MSHSARVFVRRESRIVRSQVTSRVISDGAVQGRVTHLLAYGPSMHHGWAPPPCTGHRARQPPAPSPSPSSPSYLRACRCFDVSTTISNLCEFQFVEELFDFHAVLSCGSCTTVLAGTPHKRTLWLCERRFFFLRANYTTNLSSILILVPFIYTAWFLNTNNVYILVRCCFGWLGR